MTSKKGTVDVRINSSVILVVEYVYTISFGDLTIDYENVLLKSIDISEIINDLTMFKIDQKIKEQEGWKDE